MNNVDSKSEVYSYFCDGYARCRDVFETHLNKGVLGIREGQTIVIKINMCDLKTPETGAVTHPVFLKELVKYLKQLYPSNKIIVAESDATVVFAREFYKWIGYEDALKDLEVEFINFNDEPAEEKPIDGYIFKSLPLPTVLKDCFLISAAKLKTNVTSLVTLALKNQYIFVRGLVKSVYHGDIHHAIVDANLLRKPDFSIIDGILGQGGAKAPAFGVPINANCVVFGTDPVSVDTYCTRLMGVNPHFVRHLILAEKKGLGKMRYSLKGDYPMRKVEFETSIAELLFFRLASRVQKMIQLGSRKAAE